MANKKNKERALFCAKLFESAFKGDGQTLERVLEQYADKHHDVSPMELLIECKDTQKRTALHFACQCSRSSSTDNDEEDDIVQHVLKWCQKEQQQTLLRLVQSKDKDGLTPLMLAAQVKDPFVAQKRVLLLLEHTSAANVKLGLARSKAGATPLHYAAGAGATRTTIQALYHAGPVALNSFANTGGTPLHWVCSSQNKDYTTTLNALMECGADVNATTTTTTSSSSIPPPLVLACAAGNDQHAKRLFQCPDISIEATFSPFGSNHITLFHMAAEHNLVGTLELLLKKVSSGLLQTKNDMGDTPLDLAAKKGHIDCVRLLLVPTSSTKEGPAPTQEDAKRYIEHYQRENNPTTITTQTKSTTTTTTTTTTTKSPQQEIKSDSSNSGRKTPNNNNATEEKAQRRASEILSSPNVSDEHYLEKALQLKKQGNAHFVKKEWQEAHDYYSQAIVANPKDAAFYSNRSACSISLHHPQEALEDAVIARSLKPHWDKAYYRIAVARLQLERYQDAALAAWEGLQQCPKNEELKILLQKCVQKGRQEYQTQKGASGTLPAEG